MHGTSGVVIEEGANPPRLRRPVDLARFVLAAFLAAASVFIAWLATGTSAGIGEDLRAGASLLPAPITLALNVIAGIGTLGLPIAAAVDLLVRRRGRQLFDGFVGVLISATVLTVAAAAMTSSGADQIIIGMAGSLSPGRSATLPLIGALVAFTTITQLMGRRPWGVLSTVVIAAAVAVALVSGSTAVWGAAFSLAAGWAIGLITRYAFGTPTTRPSGLEVAEALARGGQPVVRLEALAPTKQGRRYAAVAADGSRLDVTVLDRDLEGAGLVRAAWTALRLRDEPGTGAFNLRRVVDHSALMAYAAQDAGAPVPELVLVTQIGPDSALLAYRHIAGTTFAEAGAELTDADLAGAWQALATLHRHDLSHRALVARNLLRGEDGRIWLLGSASGSVAASDVALRIDLAQLLTTLALLVGVDRAVASGRAVLGDEGLGRALPALQPVALPLSIRRALRKQKQMMIGLRDALVQMRPDGKVEQVKLERFKPRTLVMIIVGSIAGYVLLSQLAQVDLATLLFRANLWWLLAGLLVSLLVFIAAAWSISGFVPEPIPLHRTTIAQVAGGFATLVSPPTLGSIAINVRFLQKSGLHPALAAASVGVSQVMAFIVHIVLLLGFGIAAGTRADFTFDPPRAVVIGVAAVAVALLALIAVPAVRRLISTRLGPMLREVLPRLVTVAQRPVKLLEGIGGQVLLNLACIAVLYACVRAFGGDPSLAVVAVVYLAGATIGQAAPTPGGLGAVEAALAAGLTAAGLDGGVAVSAVLLFRLITFWLPTIPGYWAFTWLQRNNLL